MSFRKTSGVLAALLLAGVSLSAVSGCATGGGSTAATASEGQLIGMRRITGPQYRQSMADIFGPGLTITGRFEPEIRTAGLNAIGSGTASISSSGLEQYYAMASSVAEQVLAPARRARTMPCQPAATNAPDDACARAVIVKYGRLLFRRPLTEEEVASRVALANRIGAQRSDFYSGLGEAMISLMAAPDFLFRVERAAGPARRGVAELDAYSRASRLSFLLWNSTPDDELLTAAEAGELMTPEGLQKQVDRLAASPRLTDGLTAFFDDMLQLDKLERQTKDPQSLPKFSGTVNTGAREQTLRTVIDHVVTRDLDYRDLFTTRDTFMNRELATIYKIPYGVRQGDWTPYTFSEDSGRAGILTHVSFLSLFAHPARSSPTKRGVAMNEIFLCETTPEPPGDVDFTLLEEGGPGLKTVRARMEAHATVEPCAGCHQLTDPPGLALESFDALGERRERDNGEMINVRTEWYGQPIDGAAGLGNLLHDDPKAPRCLVQNLYATATGREVLPSSLPFIEGLTARFAATGYKVPAFVKALAADPILYSVPMTRQPRPVGRPAQVAARNSSTEGNP